MSFESSEISLPPISVLMCTRNRPDDFKTSVPRLLELDYPDFEVIIVDQSTTDANAAWVSEHYSDHPRLRYVPTETVGVSVARNLAIRNAKNEICAITDDDVAVPTDWLRKTARVYMEHPETQVIFAPVHIPKEMAHRTDLHFPCFYFDDDRQLGPEEITGMGANMSLRKSLWEQIGPLDPLMGPGTKLPAAEEPDWLYRAHRAKAVIRLNGLNPVDHFAWRDHDEWDKVANFYGRGDAAFALKHLRCGDYKMAPVMLARAGRIGLRGVLRVLQRNPGFRYEFNYFSGYMAGIRDSLRYSIDHRTRLYQDGGKVGA